MNPKRLAVLAAVAAALAPAAAGRADEPADLRTDAWRAAGITTGALLADGLLACVRTPECRICVPSDLDEDARERLRWMGPASAQRLSDALANGAIPLLPAVDALRSTRSLEGAGRDVLVVAEAASLAGLATEAAKDGFARRRPGLPANGPASSAANHSLWSGHTSFAFSVAVSQATEDTLRGDAAAPLAWAIGLALATSVGYLRIAGDAHWLTDVLAGAAVGSALGVAIPLAERRLAGSVALVPGGIAVRF
ncbi:MAG TPA: phosphatase PAP2 family protein [Anaeromyxobacter sp.]|nr:phosphatase PAP2 family protein [Anaeromyxobacter sp.]